MTGLGDMGHPLATQGQRGLSAGRSQLGPDQVPVVGPQILARDDAPRGALDGGAVLDGDGTTLALIHSRPCTGERLWDAKFAGQG